QNGASATPAFAKRKSTWPASANARSTESASDTSSSIARPPISSATASIWSRVRAATITSQPSFASTRAVFAPIPRPPPVMSATLSGNCCSNRLEGLGVLQRRQVAGVGAERGRLHRAAHDLRGARLRQRVDEEDAIRLERLAELGGDVRRHLGLGR